MHLYSALRSVIRRPWKERQTDLNDCRVECVNGAGYLLEQSWLICPVQLSSIGDEHLCVIGKNPPVPLRVRMSKSAPGNRPANAHVVELLALRAETHLNVAQTLAVR